MSCLGKACTVRELHKATAGQAFPRENRHREWPVVLLVAGLFIVSFAQAQGRSGRISGTVLDPSGFSVAGAHIDAESQTGLHLTATTISDGAFSLDLPMTGMYTVR
jgi:hypothetical protein